MPLYMLLLKLLCTFLVAKNMRRLHSSRNEELKNVMLLIAHPDDESMFFSPFLYHTKPNVIVCLSKGKQGKIREKEMRRLCERRKWELVLLDYKDGRSWNEREIAKDVLENCINFNIRTIVTFDQKGVSGHKNHITCYKAANEIQRRLKDRYITFYYLRTRSIFEKYCFSLRKPCYSLPLNSFFGVESMAYHKSQLVWFRYFYLLFSNYMQFNEFRCK
ncbi:hypothetical protein GINT2_001946 [Glugoides intestinalis]